MYRGELFHQIVSYTYFSEDLSRHVITQVANALEYLHEEAGVVHRLVSSTQHVLTTLHDDLASPRRPFVLGWRPGASCRAPVLTSQ